MQPRKGYSIASLKACHRMLCPRQDVTGNQQLSYSNTRNAAAPTERVEHDLPKVLLPPSSVH